LIAWDRVYGRLAIVLTPAGERVVAERRARRRQRGHLNGHAATWWL
jgi:ribosomal protein L34